MANLEPGVPTAIFTKLSVECARRSRIALTPVADAVVRQAKINASTGSHAYGTPTPASRGTGPARISGTLVRSIDRSTVTRQVYGWLCQVGTTSGQYPTYRSRNPSSRYGRILELEGCRDGSTYPFLYYAAEFAFTRVAPILYTQTYGMGWARLG